MDPTQQPRHGSIRSRRMFLTGMVLVVTVVAVVVAVGVGTLTGRPVHGSSAGSGSSATPRPDTTSRSLSAVLGTGVTGSLDAALRREHPGPGSFETDIVIPGRRTGYSYPAHVYLPADYFARSAAHRTFPVVEMFSGTESTPMQIFTSLPLRRWLDEEIASGKLPPLIAVVPTRNAVKLPDTQCLDDPHGFKMFTYLADDVPESVQQLLRARQDRGGWATLGASSGAYCAVNIAVRRPARFSAAVSYGGYFSALNEGNTIDPTKGDPANSPMTMVTKIRRGMSFDLVSARDDHYSYHQLRTFAETVWALPGDHMVVHVTPKGGHHSKAWYDVIPTTLTELGQDLRRYPPLR